MERDTLRSIGKSRLDKESDLFTLFVDNIPASKNQSWLENLFSNYGIVRDSFIPTKRSKRGSRFGFVRYDCSISAGIAIYRANGLEVEGNFLFVKKASFDLESSRKRSDTVNLSKPRVDSRQQNMGHGVEDGKSYAQALKGKGNHGNVNNAGNVVIQTIGNGWLFRSAIAKIRKLISTEELEKEFRLEQIRDVQIRSIGGRFVIITFPNEETRNATIKERWVMNWFEDIKPWNGEQAKDERFVWLSCFGMPLNAWSMQTFKEIGGKYGQFLLVDDNMLSGKSYEKGRVLIATEHIQKVEGYMELIVDGLNYSIRVEEEQSFRKIASSTSFIDLEMEVDKKDVDLEQKIDVVKRGSVEVDASIDDMDAFSNMGWPDLAPEQNQSVPSSQLKDYGDSNKSIEEGQIQGSLISSKVAQNKSEMEKQDDMEKGDEEGNNSTKVSCPVNPMIQGDGCDEVFGESLENLEPNHNVVCDDGPNLDPIEENRNQIQAAVKGIKGKKRRKNINEILGFSKVNNRNHMGRGKTKNKCVVFRSAVAAAALNASVSSEGINNRNRMLLDEAQTIWAVNKIMGIGYDGDENEVISKIAELEAQRMESADCQL